jgi:hypothetical protein
VTESILAGGTSWLNTVPDLPLPTNVYGGDHGLTSLYAFFYVSASPSRVAAAKVDLDATFNQAARELEQIDAANGPVTTFNGSKDSYAPETRINRTNSWIFVAWLQGTLPSQLAGFAGARRIHMQAVQTRTTPAVRTLPNSIATGGPFIPPNQTTDVINNNGRLFIQNEIANGTEDPRCGIQSNPNRINLVWHEGTFPLIDVKHNGLTITPSSVPATPPTADASVLSGGLVTVTHDGWDFDTTVPIALADLGTAAGDPLIYFVNNANNALDPAAVGAFDELRVFGLAGIPGATPADAQLVSTDGPGADNSLNEEITDPSQFDDNGVDDFYEAGGQFLRLRTTPTSTVAGPHGGTRTHLFWVEARHGANSKPALRTRSFLKSGFNPANAAATFTTAHAPSLATAPQGMGGINEDEEFLPPTVHPNPRNDDDIGPFSAFATSTGNTVGIYFTTTGHFWYQEYDGTSWLGAPEIIDNETGANLFMGRDQRAYVFPPMRIGTCDNLNGTLAIYAKPPPGDDPGHRRQFLRVHD